jgi:hypothetical protein
MSQSHRSSRPSGYGPYRAQDIRIGDAWELSNGHRVQCMSTGGRGAGASQLGAGVVGWDPEVNEAGIDAGYTPEPGILRAPDIAVGNVPSKPGWVEGVPELAIEYADTGQDEEELQRKIADLLSAGTKYLWVVRLTGPRRVEIHEKGQPVRTAGRGELLRAEGVLRNPVLVESLYERDAAERATLTNLLQRRGYESFEAVLAAGREEGRKEGLQEGRKEGLQEGREEGLQEGQLQTSRSVLLRILTRRKIEISAERRTQIEACTDIATLQRWLDAAIMASSSEEVFDQAG